MKVMLSKEEVAIAVGISTQTLYLWYKFKEENPDDEYVKLLPNYEIVGAKRQKMWDKSDINDLLRYKQTIPKGRNGVMGSVTQRYLRKLKTENGEVQDG